MGSGRGWLLYGATGYTGRLIAERAARRGLAPIVAGRNAEAIGKLGRELELESRAFELVDPHRVAHFIEGSAAVLNCAGPFSKTARVMIEGCLAARVPYLDITGEMDVIEHAASQHARAEKAGIALLPAVGFDVVPSDCLAAMLAERLSGAHRLELAFAGTAGLSPGTAKTMLEALPEGGGARIDGEIKRVPVAWKAMEIPFRDGPKWATTVPWGDVASAYYTTGIPNIEVYLAMPRRNIAWLRRLAWLLPVTRLPLVHRLLESAIDRRVTGPNAADRERLRSSFWGRVTRADGTSTSATLETLSGYELTVETALAAVERVSTDGITPGFATPAKAFGKDFILSMPKSDFAWAD